MMGVSYQAAARKRGIAALRAGCGRWGAVGWAGD